MKVEICITGFSHDSITWPQCQIIIDGQVYIDKSIQGDDVIVFEVDLIPAQHNIKIMQYGKLFGENRIWHTRIIDGQVLGDRYIVINDIKFDDVSIKKIWHNGVIKNIFNERQLNDFIYNTHEVPSIVEIPAGYDKIHLNFNGGYDLPFSTPVYDWIILKKSPFMKIEGKMKESSLTSIASWRLDYTEGNALKGLYDECMELLSKVK